MKRTEQEWQSREKELLETTNRYLERAREAEKAVKALTLKLYEANTKAYFERFKGNTK